jgi:hypothetical protein
MPRDYITDAALRPQPKRDGPDFWPTPDCLTATLVTHILPSLPKAPVWEPAAGDGALVRAIEAAGHSVVAGDLITGQDFFSSSPPVGCQCLVTNPPFNQLDQFLARTVSLINSPDNSLTAAALLLRWGALTAMVRMPVLQCVWRIHVCAWRPRWIAASTTSPRWSFCWATWLREHEGPPTMYWLERVQAAVPERAG